MKYQGANGFFFPDIFTMMTAKELQRVGVLNVLGKSPKNFRAPADHPDCLEKSKGST